MYVGIDVHYVKHTSCLVWLVSYKVVQKTGPINFIFSLLCLPALMTTRPVKLSVEWTFEDRKKRRQTKEDMARLYEWRPRRDWT